MNRISMKTHFRTFVPLIQPLLVSVKIPKAGDLLLPPQASPAPSVPPLVTACLKGSTIKPLGLQTRAPPLHSKGWQLLAGGSGLRPGAASWWLGAGTERLLCLCSSQTWSTVVCEVTTVDAGSSSYAKPPSHRAQTAKLGQIWGGLAQKLRNQKHQVRNGLPPILRWRS